MTIPAGELRAALEPWLRNYAAVVAAFDAKPVRVFGQLPAVNVPSPYLVIAGLSVRLDPVECLDSCEADLQLDAWSLTDPPGFAEAEALADAAVEALQAILGDGSPGFVIPGFRVVAVYNIETQFLTDPSDGKTVHGVISATLSIDPID